MNAPAAAPIPLRVVPPGELEELVAARTASLRRDLEKLRLEMHVEMHARAVAENEADHRQQHVTCLREDVLYLKDINATQAAMLRSKVWAKTWPFVLAGLGGGFAAVALLRAAGL